MNNNSLRVTPLDQPRPQGFSHFLREKLWGRGCPLDNQNCSVRHREPNNAAHHKPLIAQSATSKFQKQ